MPLTSSKLPRILRTLAALRYPRRSLSGGVMWLVLLTTVLVLTLAGAALLLTDLRQNRQAAATDLATEAGILAFAIAPALAFDDRDSARRHLAALQERSTIVTAALYDARDRRYVEYTRAGAEAPPSERPRLPQDMVIDGERVELVRRVEQGSELLGTIYLRAHYDVTGRVRAYAGILSGVLLLALIIGLLVAGWVQHSLTEPLESMARIARSIVEDRDYSRRASTGMSNEIGVVVNAFNNMLEEVQARTTALEKSNTALEAEMQVRRTTEQALADSESLYRAIGESIDYGVWVCDASGRNIYASDSFLRLAGITQEECSDFRWAQALHPDDREDTIAAWQETVRKGVPWYREHRIRGTDGRYHPVLAQGVPIRNDSGEIIRWAGINLDIERMKESENALREADRRKDEFLATLAHELRNPLAPIRNAVRVLEMPAIDERQRRWGREVIARQAQTMALLLNDLLDVSRITRGQLELKRRHVALSEVIETAIETARPLIDAKRHALRVHVTEEPVWLDADPLRLSQVIANLLINAAKYTDAGGEIELRAALEADALEVRISDNGIGLDAAMIPALFSMFSQVSQEKERSEGGLGIGLALAKGLVELHEGSISARSQGLGHGSEFLVRLPRTLLVSAPRESSPASRASGQLIAAHLLVADDNRDAAETLAALLRLEGYRVTLAFSGAEALELASREPPDAMLLDIGMPELTGYEVAQKVRAQPWGGRIFLIAVTGWGADADRRKAKVAGFDDHMTKPIDPDRLLEQLAGALSPRIRMARSEFRESLQDPPTG